MYGFARVKLCEHITQSQCWAGPALFFRCFLGNCHSPVEAGWRKVEVKQQQPLNWEQYSQIFSSIERKLCHQLRLSSLSALRLNMSWLNCVGEKNSLLCTFCGRVHCVSFYLFRALQGVMLYLSGHMQNLNVLWLKRCSQSSLLITCNTCPTVFSSPLWPHLILGKQGWLCYVPWGHWTHTGLDHGGKKNITKIRSAGVTQEHFCQIWTHLLSGGSHWAGLWPHQVTSAVWEVCEGPQ